MLPDVKLVGAFGARFVGSDPSLVGAMTSDAGSGNDIAWTKTILAHVLGYRWHQITGYMSWDHTATGVAVKLRGAGGLSREESGVVEGVKGRGSRLNGNAC